VISPFFLRRPFPPPNEEFFFLISFEQVSFFHPIERALLGRRGSRFCWALFLFSQPLFSHQKFPTLGTVPLFSTSPTAETYYLGFFFPPLH